VHLGPYRNARTADVVARYRDAVGDYELRELDARRTGPAGAADVPVPAARRDLVRPAARHRLRPPSVHAARPLRIGAELPVTGVLTSMHLRRGRRYYKVQATASDERGVEVARSTTLGIYPDIDVERQP